MQIKYFDVLNNICIGTKSFYADQMCSKIILAFKSCLPTFVADLVLSQIMLNSVTERTSE